MNRMPTSGLRCHKWHVSQTCPSPGASFSIGNSNQCFNCSVRDVSPRILWALRLRLTLPSHSRLSSACTP